MHRSHLASNQLHTPRQDLLKTISFDFIVERILQLLVILCVEFSVQGTLAAKWMLGNGFPNVSLSCRHLHPCFGSKVI